MTYFGCSGGRFASRTTASHDLSAVDGLFDDLYQAEIVCDVDEVEVESARSVADVRARCVKASEAGVGAWLPTLFPSP